MDSSPLVRPVETTDSASWLSMRCELWPDGTCQEHQSEIAEFLSGKVARPAAVLIAVAPDGEALGFAELSIRPYAEECYSVHRIRLRHSTYQQRKHLGAPGGWIHGGCSSTLLPETVVRGAALVPNNSFKPNLLRYTKAMAERACHGFGSTTQVGLTQALDIMSNAVPAEISVQLSLALNAIERHLESTLLAVHLYGSALDGGLKPYSDIDLLVTVAARLDETVRQALVVDLLEISASPGQSEALRALEVTIVVHGDVVPWRYPARRELQFGEWQRKDILAGIFEPATTDVDLAILLTKVRQHSLALAGSAAEDFFNPVPEGDLFKALSDTLKLWNSQPDWEGDERNVVLTLSRIWYSAATGKIAPKDIVANWAMERLPDQHKPVLLEARQAYLGQGEDCLASRADQLAAFVHFVKHEATKLLSAMPVMSNNSFKPTPLRGAA